MPPDQKSFQIESIWLRSSPVSIGHSPQGAQADTSTRRCVVMLLRGRSIAAEQLRTVAPAGGGATRRGPLPIALPEADGRRRKLPGERVGEGEQRGVGAEGGRELNSDRQPGFCDRDRQADRGNAGNVRPAGENTIVPNESSR